MPIPQEVDDLQKQIKLLKDEIQQRQKKLVSLEKDIETKQQQVNRCRLHREMCKEHLQKLKRLDVVPLKDYREMVDLYEKNVDLVIANQYNLVRATQDQAQILQVLPILESMLKEAQRKLSEWNVVIEFPKR